MKFHYKRSHVTIIFTALVFVSIFGAVAFSAALFQEAEEAKTEEEYEAYMEQYNAYMAAANEQDPLKRGDMLLEFIGKYPKSDLLQQYVVPTYRTLLFECSQNQKYQELEILAEKWLELYPDNLEAIALVATAAEKLEHNEKLLKYLLKIYEIQPTADGARSIALLYDKMGNFEKYVEWCEIIFTYPEYSVDYTLHFALVQKFVEKGDINKATEYAEKTLKVLESAEKPDAAGQDRMRSIRQVCNHVIAFKYYSSDRYQEAMGYFEKALKAEKYQEGFYRIGMCLWELKDPEKAHDYFAAAELMGGEFTEKAKEYKEKLYKELHNQTLIGIEKVHKRAQAILDSYSVESEKKTELSSLN